jgi:hypothetical protein
MALPSAPVSVVMRCTKTFIYFFSLLLTAESVAQFKAAGTLGSLLDSQFLCLLPAAFSKNLLFFCSRKVFMFENCLF